MNDHRDRLQEQNSAEKAPAPQRLKAGGPYVNRYGRKGGRGVRPWLLGAKVLMVNAALGATLSACAIAWLARRSVVDPDAAAAIVRFLLSRLVHPAMIGAVVTGVALFLQHPRVFLRQRWLQCKWAVLVGLVLPLMVLSLRQSRDASAVAQSLPWLLAALAASLVVVVLLGRIKPRLGQPIQSAASKRPAASESRASNV
ncbi:MAG TPA: hypothetical protein VF184_13910 [Phycisphaeraceae bacterium]